MMNAVVCLLVIVVLRCQSYQIRSPVQGRPLQQRASTVRLDASNLEHDVEPRGESSASACSRRHVLATAAALAAGLPSFAAQADDEVPPSVSFDLGCLADLPAVPADNVRIFLCRHGETENNRLNRVQGSRIDPDINETGIKQAGRLGQALARAVQTPDVLLHSPLTRARQTAEQAASRLFGQRLEPLSALAEIDFGPFAEGQPVNLFRAEMVATYSAWAGGEIDTRMVNGGESGREILSRIEYALQSLVEQASNSKTGCIAAVAHSAYLRMMLAVLQDVPLLQVARIEQKNACVNVVDINADKMRTLTARSPLLGGHLSRAPSDFSFRIPEARVIRINEKRHLGGLLA